MIRKQMRFDLSRRELMLAALACCGTAVAGSPGVETSLLGSIRTHLSMPRNRGTAAKLARAIVFGDSPPNARAAHWSDAELAARIRDNIQADYRNDRIVEVGFWRLSATESNTLALMRRLQIG